MESNAIRRDIDDVRRHRLGVYRSQVTPAWAWPLLGTVVFLFFSSYALDATWVKLAAPLAYVGFVGIWVGMITRRSGVRPRVGSMPKALLGELVGFWVAGALFAGAVVALGLTVSWLLAGAVAGVGTAVGGRHSDRRYRNRADTLAGSDPAAAL